MAKKTNRKPGSANVSNSFALKKQKNNLNQSKMSKIIVILMVLAFVGVPIAGLLIYLI